ncbi:MAG: type VI secretion system protein TssA [Burkholderiaceae bacterium]|nr:type VI secretion system protein TssA [Burkholderiaceae bacterium]
MSSTEIELLKVPVDGQKPCGEDLEYDEEFLALHQATQRKREQQFGNTVIPAEAPDWSKAERLAKQLCQRTRDLRVLAQLTLARTELRGLPGYVEGLRLINALLDTFWNDLHPHIVSDDGDEDPMPRMNALAVLGESEGLGRAVRDARLLDDGGICLTLRQVETLMDSSGSAQIDFPGGVSRLREMVHAADAKASPPLQALREALLLLGSIREKAAHELGQSWAPDFSRLERSLRSVAQLLPDKPATAPDPATDMAPASDAHDKPADNSSASPRRFALQDITVTSRADAQALLEKVCQYLESSEPSHPGPMLIRRAQKLLDLNFFQIIEDLLPEGVQKIEGLAGRPIGGAPKKSDD